MTTATVTQPASQGPVPVTNLTIDGTVMDNITIEQVTVSNFPSAHEGATLTTLMVDTDPSQYIDAPVTFDWGPSGGREQFVGYLTDVTKDQQFQSQPATTLTVSGPTWPMSKGKPRFWVRPSLQDIVSRVATDNNLGYQVDPHWYTFPSYAQTVESDWGIVVSASDDLGFMVFPHRGVIRSIDPAKELSKGAPAIKLMKSTTSLSNTETLLDFTPLTSSDDARDSAKPSYGYLSSGEAVVLNPGGPAFLTDTFIPDPNRARVVQERSDRASGFWSSTAQARVRGNPSIVGGTVVNVLTGASGTVRDANDGLWLVLGAAHNIDRASFNTQLFLARDIGRLNEVAPATDFWVAARKPRPQLTLVNGQWVSSWSAR